MAIAPGFLPTIRRSIRLRFSSAEASPRSLRSARRSQPISATMKLISMSAVPRTACSRAVLALVSWRSRARVTNLTEAASHLARVDGVMMGRAAYQEPWRLIDVDPFLFGVPAQFVSPQAVAQALIPYVEGELARGTRLHAITRPVLGLFRGMPGSRAFRRHLATEAIKPGSGIATLCAALARLPASG